jgi:response regulator RpfG family c-di-GMP phosphodiesterase
MTASVLLVDEDVPFGKAMSQHMQGHGLSLEYASGEASALASAAVHAYDAIVVDSDLGLGGGLRTLDILHRLQPQALCVLSTAGRDLDLLVSAVDEHAVTALLLKPWRPADLGSLLERTRGVSAAVLGNDDEAIELLRRTFRTWSSRLHGRGLRVSRLAHLLAVELGVTGQELAVIVQASLVSDVGMLAVPAEVLAKAGPLAPEEWDTVRRHTGTGCRLIAALGRLEPTEQIVAQHHERWDGSGYPAGKRGAEICLGARILAVADALAALTDDRPYRPRLELAGAVHEIRACSGSQFDPQVVEALRRISMQRLTNCLKAADAGEQGAA